MAIGFGASGENAIGSGGMSEKYDLFVIGAGSGGVRAARMAARTGAKVGIAEMGALGGTCVNVGCVPKKLMVYAAHFREDFADAAGFGWTVGERTFDWATFKAAKDKEIARLNGIYGRLLKGAGCALHTGRAALVDAHTVEVTNVGKTERFEAENILIATGGHPVRPTEPGNERAWVSDDVFAIESQPKRLIVVGGGYIAIEMACIFHGLGSEVTLVYRGPHPLRGFDDDVRTFLCDELRKKGITLHLNTTVRCLQDGDDGGIAAMLSHDDLIEADAVLYAIGRRPSSPNLGLEQLGVAVNDKGAIIVDEHYRTSVPNIFALGDVTDRINLTPVAIAEAMALVQTLFGDGPGTVDYDHLPTAVFSTPPLATVGLTESEAKGTYDDVHVYTTEVRPMKNTLSGNDERTFMKMIVHAETGGILGVHIVGADGPEMIQTVAVAMKCGATKAQFDQTIGLHPTAAEELVTMRERRPDE